jgi:phosphoglucomutase
MALWAILLWLNILAVRRQSVSDIVKRPLDHMTGGHSIPATTMRPLRARIANRLVKVAGRQAPGVARACQSGSLTVERADSFTYHDPVDGSIKPQSRDFASSLKAARALCSGFRAPAPPVPR